ERQAQKDSLLLGRELEIALERQHHPREAAQVALEVWLAAPSEAVWANIAVVRLLPLDPRGVREAVRRVAERTPERPDLARAQARALRGARGQEAGAQPELALERALADLRDGPPERALSGLRATAESSLEAKFRYAEGLFFAGECDSALAWYQRVATDPNGPF